MTIPAVSFVAAAQTADAEPRHRPYTVVYDGNCKVCERTINLLRKWDRDHVLEVIPSQAPGVYARFPWIPGHAYAASMQVIGPESRTWQGAAALEQLLEVLPKGKLFSWIFKIPLMRALADRLYRWFARNRYRLGCSEHCQLRSPDPDFVPKS